MRTCVNRFWILPAAPAIAIPLDAQPGFTGSGLVTPHHTACRPLPDVLVDYLPERQATVDFSPLQRLADLLGKLFWADLEAHQPGISSLKLPRDAATAWKQHVMTRTKTTATSDGRSVQAVTAWLDGRSVLTAVRAFCLGTAEWADEDPGPVGAARGALPGQRQRRLPQERPIPAQVPDGPVAPGTAARAGRPRSPGPMPGAPPPPGAWRPLGIPRHARLLKAVREFDSYSRANAGRIPNYGERQRADEAISAAFTESAVNQVISKRMVKKQQMR